MRRLRDIAAGLAVILAMAAVPDAAPASAPDSSIRPEPRPVADDPAPEVVAVLSTAGILRSPRPEARPRGLQERMTVRAAGVRTQPAPGAIIGREGGLCGRSDIEGVRLSPITARTQGCGIEEPVRVTAVGGVRLSEPATIDCPTALALRTWVADALVPAVGHKGDGVARLEIGASYVCRPRNNQKGAKISEHGRGRAVDVMGVTFRNGSRLTVLEGWRDRTNGAILQSLHRAACGPFGTVLGPNSDRFHQNHFHFDTARYRNGTYCR